MANKYAAYGTKPESVENITISNGVGNFSHSIGEYSETVSSQLSDSLDKSTLLEKQNKELLNTIETLENDIQNQSYETAYYKIANQINYAPDYKSLANIISTLLPQVGGNISIYLTEGKKKFDHFFDNMIKELPIIKNGIIPNNSSSSIYPPLTQQGGEIYRLLNQEGPHFSSINYNKNLPEAQKEIIDQLNIDLFKKLQTLMTHTYNAHRAISNPLTGLYNKAWYNNYGEKSLEFARKNKIPYCAFMADINDFKKFNSDHGHFFGDDVIVTIGNVLKEVLGQSESTPGKDGEKYNDYPSHWGGDESAGILLGKTELEIQTIFTKIFHKLKTDYEIYDTETKEIVTDVDMSTLSIGYAYISGGNHTDSSDFSDIMKHANNSMFQAKDIAKGQNGGIKNMNPVRDSIFALKELAEKLNYDIENKSVADIILEMDRDSSVEVEKVISAYHTINSEIGQEKIEKGEGKNDPRNLGIRKIKK